MLVPSPGVPLDGLGIMLSVVFVLAATLTLLPAVLAKLGPGWTGARSPGSHPGEQPFGALRGLG